MTNFLEVAKRRWPNCPIQGSGRWALCSISKETGRTLRVWLVGSQSEARRGALGCDRHEIVDLDPPKSVLEMHDRYEYEDRRWERQRRRAEKEQALGKPQPGATQGTAEEALGAR